MAYDISSYTCKNKNDATHAKINDILILPKYIKFWHLHTNLSFVIFLNNFSKKNFQEIGVSINWICTMPDVFRAPDKSAYLETIFFISHPKHICWVLRRTISMSRYFLAPKHIFKLKGKEIITINVLIWNYA